MASVIEVFLNSYLNDLNDLCFFSDSDFPGSFTGVGAVQTPANQRTQGPSVLQSLAVSGGGGTEEIRNAASPDHSGAREPKFFVDRMENARMMQRSFRSRSFDGRLPDFPLRQPHLDGVVAGEGRIPVTFTSDSGEIKRICSVGDLPKIDAAAAEEEGLMAGEHSRAGRYSAEVRKERIHRYRAKRNQRNFNKTIKYACRKTLADSRHRIRGRFARNDDALEIPKPACSNTYEDGDGFFLGHSIFLLK